MLLPVVNTLGAQIIDMIILVVDITKGIQTQTAEVTSLFQRLNIFVVFDNCFDFEETNLGDTQQNRSNSRIRTFIQNIKSCLIPLAFSGRYSRGLTYCR